MDAEDTIEMLKKLMDRKKVAARTKEEKEMLKELKKEIAYARRKGFQLSIPVI